MIHGFQDFSLTHDEVLLAAYQPGVNLADTGSCWQIGTLCETVCGEYLNQSKEKTMIKTKPDYQFNLDRFFLTVFPDHVCIQYLSSHLQSFHHEDGMFAYSISINDNTEI